MQILFADDHLLFRESMEIWLHQELSGLHIHHAASFDEVIARFPSHSPFDLIVLDLNMPGMHGVLSVASICKQSHPSPVLILSAACNPLTMHLCLTSGAAGYATKSSDGTVTMEAIRTLLRGEQYIPPELKQARELPRMSAKKLELLAALANGESNQQIATRLYLSEGSVKQYISKILRILEVDNRTQASIKAREILGIGGS